MSGLHFKKNAPRLDHTKLDQGSEHDLAQANYHVERAYARWAPIYDLVFAAIMRPGRMALAEAASRKPGLVLDVGVGTGLELPMFSAHVELIGIDLSEPMLRRARSRVKALRLANVVGLLVMDATRLAFPDNSFDVVVAPYVLTVLPDPHRSLDELLRVVKPQGEIILVNHIGAQRGALARTEAWLGKRSKALGWRPEFPWSLLQDWINMRPCRLIERRALPPLKLFTLVRLIKL